MAEEIKKYCPGFPKVDCQPIDCTEHLMVDLKVKVNEDHTVSPDDSNVVDLDALTQTYRDQCGMEAAKRLLKSGQAQPSDFADDGKSNYDGTIVPETAQERANAAVAAGVKVDAVKAKYGIDPNAKMSDEQFDALIKDYISKNLDKFVAQAPKSTEGGNE